MSTKFKVGDTVKIVSKSINSPLVKSFWHNEDIKIIALRYNGKILGYVDGFYYAVNKGYIHGAFHFLEKDLRFPYEEDVIKELNWDEFEI